MRITCGYLPIPHTMSVPRCSNLDRIVPYSQRFKNHRPTVYHIELHGIHRNTIYTLNTNLHVIRPGQQSKQNKTFFPSSLGRDGSLGFKQQLNGMRNGDVCSKDCISMMYWMSQGPALLNALHHQHHRSHTHTHDGTGQACIPNSILLPIWSTAFDQSFGRK